MDFNDLYRIIQNNKNVPFIKKIIDKTQDKKLSISTKDGKIIVYTGSLDQSFKENDFIEFAIKEDAQWFIDNYKEYNKERTPDEMNQQQFEKWRTTKPVKFKYEGTIKNGKYSGTVEKI